MKQPQEAHHRGLCSASPWPSRSVETAVLPVAVRGSSSGVDSNVIDVNKEQKQEEKEEKQQ